MMNTKKNKKQMVNGIEVYGEKVFREKEATEFQEDSAVNFTGTGGSNIGKVAVYLLRSEVFRRIFSPLDGDLYFLVHQTQILQEDEDSFIVGCRDEASFVMKYAELYSFFRIVDSFEEASIIEIMIENYAQKLFEQVEEKLPFDTDMLEELEASLEEGFYGGKPVSIEEQEKVMEKLKRTPFPSFSQPF